MYSRRGEIRTTNSQFTLRGRLSLPLWDLTAVPLGRTYGGLGVQFYFRWLLTQRNRCLNQKDGLLVTSGFDGSIFTWDINSYTDQGFIYHKVFHTSGLMRCRKSPDASKMVIWTTGGYLKIVHGFDLTTLAKDLCGFMPNIYRLMQKRNRVELVSDFPEEHDAEVVCALQIHPHGWSALSRNISYDEGKSGLAAGILPFCHSVSYSTLLRVVRDQRDAAVFNENLPLPGFRNVCVMRNCYLNASQRQSKLPTFFFSYIDLEKKNQVKRVA